MNEEKTKAARSSVVRLRGLPYQATGDDIRQFFDGFEIVYLHICRRNGRATGEAYVQFSSETDATQAIKAKNSQYMGHRYIEIFEALEGDLGAKKAIGPGLKGYVVRMRGLPFNATAEQVASFFDGLEVVRGAQGVVFTRMPDGRPTGEAYVEFPSAESQEEAMKKHKEKIGSRYIELFLSSKGDMLQAMQQNGYYTGQPDRRKQQGQSGSSHNPAISQDGTTLELRGLPYNAGVEEITKFFTGFSLSPKDVQLPTKIDQRTGTVCNTGYAYVRFDSQPDAERAREAKHRAMMGSRYIECLPYPNKQASPGLHKHNQQHGTEDGADARSTAGQGPGTSQPPPPKANGRGHVKVGPPVHMPPQGQHVIRPHDYTAQQQQMLMQQHYMMQQQVHMMQQQQAVRAFDPVGWGNMGGGMVQHPQGAPVGTAWYKGYPNPAMVFNPQGGAMGVPGTAMAPMGQFPPGPPGSYTYHQMQSPGGPGVRPPFPPRDAVLDGPIPPPMPPHADPHSIGHHTRVNGNVAGGPGGHAVSLVPPHAMAATAPS